MQDSPLIKAGAVLRLSFPSAHYPASIYRFIIERLGSTIHVDLYNHIKLTLEPEFLEIRTFNPDFEVVTDDSQFVSDYLTGKITGEEFRWITQKLNSIAGT